MSATKRKFEGTAYGISHKVRTVRGKGIIKYVFPAGPHGRLAYSVHFANKRVGEIFNEDEVTLIEKS